MRFTLMGLFLITLFTHTHAAEYQSISELEKLAKAHVEKQLKAIEQAGIDHQVHLGNIDARLQLSPCHKNDLTFFTAYERPIETSGSLGIRCSGESTWSIYVPLKVKMLAKVVVAKQFIPQGSQITKAQLKQVKRDIKTLHRGYFNDINQVVGKISKQSIGVNHIINPNRIALMQLIHKGETVTISAIDKLLKVSMKGIALRSGRLGDIIPVKNVASERVIEAQVIDFKKVQIKL